LLSFGVLLDLDLCIDRFVELRDNDDCSEALLAGDFRFSLSADFVVRVTLLVKFDGLDGDLL
jgi:hypothetical protein